MCPYLLNHYKQPMGTQHYSKQIKEAIIKKLNQSELSFRQFAKQESMNPSMLYKWKEEFKISGSSVSKEIPLSNGQRKKNLQSFWKPRPYLKLK